MNVDNGRCRARARARARARVNAKWVENTTTAGAVAGAVAAVDAGAFAGDIESAYWKTQLPPGYRQMIVGNIMQTLRRQHTVNTLEGVQELNNISANFEEHTYISAVSKEDYLQKISYNMPTLEPTFQNPMTNYYLHLNAASSDQNAHGPEMTMEAAAYKTTSGPEESDEEQATEEDDAGVLKEDVVEEVVVTKEQNYVVGHEENARVGENEISCGLSAGATLDERLVQVEERLEKMEAHSEKVETLLVDINEKLNYLVKMQDAKVSRDVRRPAKYTSSSWTSNGRSKRKHRVAEMIRQLCKHRRLGRDAIAQ